MKLRTKNKVNYTMPPNQNKFGYVEMSLGLVSIENDFTKIGVNHTYLGVQDDGLTEKISSGAFYMDEATINTTFEAIKPLISSGGTYVDQMKNQYYIGSKYKMAETFGVSPNDIEFID